MVVACENFAITLGAAARRGLRAAVGLLVMAAALGVAEGGLVELVTGRGAPLRAWAIAINGTSMGSSTGPGSSSGSSRSSHCV